MIKKLKQTVKGFYDKPSMPTAIEFFNKINELVDTVNELGKDMVFLRRKVLETTYKEPDPCKSMTYMSDGHIKKFYGHDSIVELEVPLPQGTKIKIRSIAKGGDND